MYLLLDLSDKARIHLALFDEYRIVHKETGGRNRELLGVIHDFLTEEGLNKKDVHGIMAVLGAGSFTNTRITAVVANAWAYAYGIPLLPIRVSDISRVQGLITNLVHQPRGQYMSPAYSAEPNIGHLTPNP